MVMIGRFSSDDPGWREPWDREPDRARDDDDWVGLNPRSQRAGARMRRAKRSSPSKVTAQRRPGPPPNSDPEAGAARTDL